MHNVLLERYAHIPHHIRARNLRTGRLKCSKGIGVRMAISVVLSTADQRKLGSELSRQLGIERIARPMICLLYTSDAADD